MHMIVYKRELDCDYSRLKLTDRDCMIEDNTRH